MKVTVPSKEKERGREREVGGYRQRVREREEKGRVGRRWN